MVKWIKNILFNVKLVKAACIVSYKAQRMGVKNEQWVYKQLYKELTGEECPPERNNYVKRKKKQND